MQALHSCTKSLTTHFAFPIHDGKEEIRSGGIVLAGFVGGGHEMGWRRRPQQPPNLQSIPQTLLRKLKMKANCVNNSRPEYKDEILSWLHSCRWPSYRIGCGCSNNKQHRQPGAQGGHRAWCPQGPTECLLEGLECPRLQGDLGRRFQVPGVRECQELQPCRALGVLGYQDHLQTLHCQQHR